MRVMCSQAQVLLYSDKSPPNGLLSETRMPIDTAINNCETNSDKSPPNGLLSEADCCPKTEYSDSDKSPLRTRVRLPVVNIIVLVRPGLDSCIKFELMALDSNSPSIAVFTFL